MNTNIHRGMAAALALCLPWTAQATIDWFNTETNLVGYADQTTPLKGDTFDSTLGCFVQLIWAGPNDLINPAVNQGPGVTGDDQVLAVAFVGQASFFPIDGLVIGGNIGNDSNGFYYVRAWSAPSPDFAGGLVPTSPTNRYGDSTLWANPGSRPGPDSFNFGGPRNESKIGIITAQIPAADTDSDGMPDWWEFQFSSNATNASSSGDADGDGLSNWQEFVSGTQPTNASSVFKAESIAPTSGTGRVIRWNSATNRTYDLLRTSSLTTQSLQTVATGLPATPPVNSYTDNVGSAAALFYRVRVNY
ncbi:MAG: hypothetical protein V1929_11975 [bacterium]